MEKDGLRGSIQTNLSILPLIKDHKQMDGRINEQREEFLGQQMFSHFLICTGLSLPREFQNK